MGRESDVSRRPALLGPEAGRASVSLAGLLVAVVSVALLPSAARAQVPSDPDAKTRAEAVEYARREKVARLWPERTSPIAEIANDTPNPRQPFVGRCSFAHKGGMHVHAVARAVSSYEHIEPEKETLPAPESVELYGVGQRRAEPNTPDEANPVSAINPAK